MGYDGGAMGYPASSYEGIRPVICVLTGGLIVINPAYQTIDVKTSYSSKYVKKALEVTLNNENGLKAIFGAD
ncbi:MAG: hypothetical protein K6A37_00165 [Saccharofermentans sp.]|nr:hypothetical protein [Saccharofermentans sp.]